MSAIAQNNPLARKISINLNNVPVSSALTQISRQGNFVFSYNSDIITQGAHVTLKVDNKTVTKVLKEAFAEEFKYKAVGNHVIILANTPKDKPNKEEKKKNYIISGFVIDSRTGEKLKEATIYEFDDRVVTVTNELGYFSIELPAKDLERGINFSKDGYVDTVIIIQPTNKQQYDITLKPREYDLAKISSKSVETQTYDIHNRKLVKLMVPDESKTISDNLDLHETRLFQVSLLPFLGTNHKVSGSVDNVVSLNVLAGYSSGVRGLELGGLANINRKNMYGAQFGGVGNAVGGQSDGLQMAGIVNYNAGNFTGVQVGGISNLVLDTLTGVQLAGIQNVLRGEMKGVQLSGISNVSLKSVDGLQATGIVNVAFNDVNLAQLAGIANYGRNVGGVQAAGILNFALGDVNTLQISGIANFCHNVGGAQLAGIGNVAWGDVNAAQIGGIFNYTKNIEGAQVAGLINVATGDVNESQLSGLVNVGKNVEGYQLAGLVNAVAYENNHGQIAGLANFAQKVDGLQVSYYGNIASKEVNGVQLAAMVNFTGKLNGVQLALINFADTVESGVPVGLLSFVRKGYICPELYADEIFSVNAGVKLGVSHFYNIIAMGWDSENLIKGTYGVGTSLNLKKKWHLSIDATYNLIMDRQIGKVSQQGNLYRVEPTIEFRLFDFASLYAGPSYNVYRSKYSATDVNYRDISFHPFYEYKTNMFVTQMWIGAKAGLRFSF